MKMLSSYIDDFKNVSLLVVGDLMLDRFTYGSVDRISPEAPVPVFKLKEVKEMLGGAGNVAANICSLGGKTTFIGAVGDDDDGKRVADFLKKTGVTPCLVTVDDFDTIVKTRMIASKNHLLRLDQEIPLKITDDFLNRLYGAVEENLENVDLVLLSDYGKGVLTFETTAEIIKLCQKHKKPVFVDPKDANYAKYRGATLVKPNLKEFSLASGRSFDPKDADFQNQIQKSAEELFKKFDIRYFLVTLSEHGMIFISSDSAEETLSIPTEAKEVFDVSGAGDTSFATLGLSIGAGASVKEAMKLANAASGVVVGKLGTACVTPTELENALSEKSVHPKDGWKQKRKIVSVNQAAEIAEQLRKNGKKVGFTNGCFDLLHLGHLNSFMQAKNECDVLIVGLNTDASVRRLKGENRPVNDEKTRAMFLAALEFIDYVVLFDEDTAISLVRAIRPDIVAKEGYALENWPEAQEALKLGLKTVTLKRFKDYSTTNLIQKLKAEK